MRTTVSIGSDGAQAKPVNGSQLGIYFRQALENCHAKHGGIAAAMGISEPMLSQVLAGQKPLRAVYIDRLPVEVRRELARLFAEAHGLIVAPRLDEAAALALTLRGVLALQHARTSKPSTNQE